MPLDNGLPGRKRLVVVRIALETAQHDHRIVIAHAAGHSPLEVVDAEHLDEWAEQLQEKAALGR